MEPKELLEICDRLIEQARSAGADEVEAVAASGRSVETHLEKNDIHIAQTGTETSFGLRVFCGERVGFVTANDVGERATAASAAEAIAQAHVSPPDPLAGLPDPEPVIEIPGMYREDLASLSVADTTRLAADMIARVSARDRRVNIDSGTLSVSVSSSAITSTRGVRASERETSADFYLFGMAVDGDDVASFDYDTETSRDRGALDDLFAQTADRFTDKCVAGLGARKGESFRGGVVLSPDAVFELIVPNLINAVCANSVRKGRSMLAEKLGHTIAAACFSLTDDATIPGGAGSSAFDREGVPTRRSSIVDAGVLRTFLWNHYEARAAGGDARSTGHASGGVGTLPGIGPSSLDVAAGETKFEDLLHPDSRTILVNRFSGSVNGVNGDFSGVVKNGALLGAGDPVAIKETMIAGNLFSLLKNISAMSRRRKTIGGTRTAPYIRVEDVSVTAG